jgi:cobalt-zinc-cadmium efflux system membrane fusion protein
MKKIIYNTAIYSIILLLLVTSCGEKSSTEEEGSSTDTSRKMFVSFTALQIKNTGLKLGGIESRKLSSAIQVNGILDVPPQNLVSVSALMGGFIKSTELLQGTRVHKGQVLVVIQNPDFITIQRDYLENKTKLDYLKLEYKRQEELSKENISAAKIFQQVSSEYTSAEVANGSLEEKLRMIGINPLTLTQKTIRSSVSILSPINGYITVVNINVGKYVAPQDVICEIVDTEHLHAELTVFEKDITKIKVGQKILFTMVNEDNKERSAHVYLINHKISEDRTVRVHAHMDKEDPTLLPNMYLKAFIETDEQEANTLPDKAIVNSAGTDYIFVESSDKPSAGSQLFEGIEVKKGISENGYTEVILPENFNIKGAKVVIDGAYDLLSKMNNVEEE